MSIQTLAADCSVYDPLCRHSTSLQLFNSHTYQSLEQMGILLFHKSKIRSNHPFLA
jgi:hypothetical protein